MFEPNKNLAITDVFQSWPEEVKKKNDTNTPEILSLVFLGLYYFL